MLPLCVHIGIEPMDELGRCIVNDRPGYDRDKPYGGLWTSTLDVEHGTDWLRACKEMNMIDRHAPQSQAWVVHPKQNIRVLHIECEEDYDFLCELYPRESGSTRRYMDGRVEPILYVDWEAVAEEYDVVWVQDWQCGPRAWDCETILYLNWECIERVEKHEWSTRKYERMCA